MMLHQRYADRWKYACVLFMSANCQDFNPWANNVPTNAPANLVVKNNSGLSSGQMNSNQAMANNQGAFKAWEPNRYQAPRANNMAPYNPWQAPNQPQGFTQAQTQAHAQAQAQAQTQSFTQATAQNQGQSQNLGFTQWQGQAKGQNQNLGIPAFQGAAMSSRAGQFYNGGHNQNGGYNQSNQQPYGLYPAQDRVNQCSSSTQAFSNSSTHNARANDYAYTQAPVPMMNQGLSPRPNMAMATGQVYSQAQAQGLGHGQSNSQGSNQSSNKSCSYGKAMSQGQSVSRGLAMGQELAVGQSQGQSQGMGQSGQCQANGYGGGANYNTGSTVSQSDVYKGQVATANQEQVVKSDDCCGAVVDGNLALNEEASLEVMESSSDKEHRRPLNNQGQLSNYPPCGPKTVHARHFKTNTKAANENMEGAEGKASVNTAGNGNGNGKATNGNEIVFKHELLQSTLSSSNHAHVINFGSDVKQRKIALKDCFEEKINLEYFYLPEYDLSLSPLVPSKNKQYVFDPDNLEQILRHLQNNHGDSLFLSGPTGCGKTSLILEIASRLDWPVECITLSQTSEVADLIGHNILKKGQITFEYGPLSRAMMYGEILLLNEIDLMSAGELTALNDVLEGRALCVNANNGEVIYPHPFFRVVATANSKGLGDNSGNYLGVRKQNKAFLDRWIFFECTYPDYDLEQNLILKNFTNINPDLIKYFAVLARELRFAAGLGVSKTNKDLLIEMKNFFKDNYHDYPGNLDLLVSDNTVPKIDELLEKQTFDDDGVSLSLSELDNLASLQVELNPHLSVPLSTRSLLRIIRLYLSDNQLSITDAVRHGFAARLEPKEFAFVMRMTFEIFGYVSEFDKLPRTISNVEEYLDFRKQNISKEIVERLLLSEDSLRAMFDKSAPVAANSKDNLKESDLLKPDVIEAKTTSSGAKSKSSNSKTSKSKTKEAKASKAVDSQDASFEKTDPLSSSDQDQVPNAHEVKSQDAESSSSQGQSLSAKSKPDHSLEQEKSATKSASTLSPDKPQESHEGSNNDKPQAQAMPQDLPQSQALPQELAQSKPQTEPKAAEPKAQPKGSGSGSSSMADDVRKKDKVVEEIKKFIRDTEPGLADKFIVVRGQCYLRLVLLLISLLRTAYESLLLEAFSFC